MKAVLLVALVLVASAAAHGVHTDAKEHKEHTHESVAQEVLHNALHLDDKEAPLPDGTGLAAGADDDAAGAGAEGDDDDDVDVTPLTEEETKLYAQKLENYLVEKCSTSTPDARAAFGVCDDANCTQPALYPQWPRASCLLAEQNVTLAEVTLELKTVLQLYGVDSLQALDQIEAEEEADLQAEEAAFYAEEGHEDLHPAVDADADAAATTGAAAPAAATA